MPLRDIESIQRENSELVEAIIQQITITTAIVDRFIEIRIADNGKGMPEEVKQKIFEHLFTTKGVGMGTGLGLAIAKQIVVEKHNGYLNVKSELGQGTEFCIGLPTIPNSGG
jgi:signal transduction histidine kinase